MASNQVLCQFSILETKMYPPRYSICEGVVVAIEECNKIDENGHSESSLILSRSGRKYEESKDWNICEKHRRVFGFSFSRELKQKKCMYPNHWGVEQPVKLIPFENSYELLHKKNLVVPYGLKVCKTCLFAFLQSIKG